MKCLFFLYGEYRTFPTACKTWNILDIPNLDILIHTPSTTSDHRGNLDLKNITIDHFNILKNTKIFLYDRDEYQKTDMHVLHYSYRFLSKYLKENPTQVYDYIFIGRLDSSFYLENYTDLFNKKENNLFALNTPYINPPATFIPDHTFFGTYEVIKKFVDNLPPSELLENSHSDMAHYVNDNFESLEWQYPFDCAHIRPNMVSYFDDYFNKNEKIKEIDRNYISFINDFYTEPYYGKLDTEYKQLYSHI